MSLKLDHWFYQTRTRFLLRGQTVFLFVSSKRNPHQERSLCSSFVLSFLKKFIYELIIKRRESLFSFEKTQFTVHTSVNTVHLNVQSN